MYSKSIEDYLEAIYNIISEKGYVRAKDIAKHLDVTPPSVSAMLSRLKENDLIFYEKYGGLTLTPEGERTARSVKKKHDTLKKLLEIIYVSEDVAEKDACDMEHNLSPESVEQLTNFVRFIETRPTHPVWLDSFREFCEKGEYECRNNKG